MLEKAITISVFRPFETKAFMMNLLILDPAQNFNFNLAARTNYKF